MPNREPRLCQISILFSDLCGYTALGEARDAEDVDHVRRAVLELADRTVREHEGLVSQFYGDGLLALFGLPEPDEQDARRSIEAALTLHERIRALRLDRYLPPGFETRMHSGIATGLVVAREGNLKNGQYELSGDTVNTSARLCAAAGRDEILVTDVTLQGLGALFELEALPPLMVAGKNKSVAACRVLGRSHARTRFEGRARRGLTPFVGRAAALARLEEALARARGGERQIVGVIGSAGIGKTRLFQEFLRRAGAAGAAAHRLHCESYGKVAPFQPFVEPVRRLLGITAETPELAAAAAVERQAEPLGLDRAQIAILLHLLSLSPLPAPAARSSDELQRGIVALLTALFAQADPLQPWLLIVDDWQWADEASRQVVRGLIERAADRSAMIVLGARDRALEDGVLAGADLVDLAAFTEDESKEAVRSLMPTLPGLGLGGVLHRRSGGNPLFLEELCQSLPADVALSGENLAESAVPNTVHGVVQARLRRLPEREARLLEAAAVIGNDLPLWLLEHVTGLGPQLRPALDALVEDDFIYRTDEETTLRFKHEISRDGVYQFIRKEARRQIHRRVAVALEERFTGAARAGHYEALAYHFARSEDHERGAAYAELAGDKAASTSSLDRARLQYRAALAQLDRLEGGARADRARAARWLAVAMKWAAACVFNPALEQTEIMRQAAACAQELGDQSGVALAEYWLGWIHYALGDQEQAIHHSERALAMADAAGNRRLRAQLLSNLGQSHGAAGRHDLALQHLREGIELKRAAARQAKGPVVPVGFAYALACEAVVHADRGEFDEAERCLAEADQAVGGSGHAIEGSLLTARGLAQMWQGRFHECAHTALLTRATAERVNGSFVFAMSEMMSGYALFHIDRTSAALERLRRAVDWLESRDVRLYLSCSYAALAEALLGAGDLAAAQLYAARALARATEHDPLGSSSACRTMALASAATPGADADVAISYLDRAAAGAAVRGSRRELALTQLARGELALARGRPSEARAPIHAALEELRRMRMPGYVAIAEGSLARAGAG